MSFPSNFAADSGPTRPPTTGFIEPPPRGPDRCSPDPRQRKTISEQGPPWEIISRPARNDTRKLRAAFATDTLEGCSGTRDPEQTGARYKDRFPRRPARSASHATRQQDDGRAGHTAGCCFACHGKCRWCLKAVAVRSLLPHRVGGRLPGPHGLADWPELPPAAASNRACGSPAHGSPTSFTGWHTQASVSPFRSGDRCRAGSPTHG